jgi:NAD(P)-dependent dehydrogenase (short-subunit alcohol dehydrogenase family)
MSSPAVLITGALTGIGRAAAVIFAQEGATVVVSGRRDKQGKELVAELQALGANAIFAHADVRNEDDVRNLVDQTVKRFGRLDIAVNKAATEGSRGLVTEQTAESYAATFDTNVLGVLLSMKHELRAMLPQESGSIVNVSSAYGSVGAAGASVYCSQQTCGGRADKIRSAGSRRDRSSGKRSRSGHYGYEYAHTLHQHR